MKTVYFINQIASSPDKVYEAMLNREIYKQWTQPFGPTCDFRGTWAEGSRMYFTATDEEGNEMGLISEIDKNIPAELVIIRHIGFFSPEGEQFEGEEVEKWRNVLEVYRFKPEGSGTRIICSVEISSEEDESMFDKSWPEALESLKQICEK